jgi:hypothetical protein
LGIEKIHSFEISKNLFDHPPDQKDPTPLSTKRLLRGKPDIGPKVIAPVPDKLTAAFDNDDEYFLK